MESLTPTELDVLNATADDAENLEQIYLLVRHSPNVATLTEVAFTVSSLLDRKLLTCVADEEGRPAPAPDDPSLVWRGWFEMTPEGRQEWQSSIPADLSSGGDEGPSAGRVYAGMFRESLPDLSREEIDEARREMWGNFPRDLPE